MTWEADIVDRAGRRSISGQFRITSDGEAAKFIAELKALVAKAKLDRANVIAREPAPSIAPSPAIKTKVREARS